jgi:hypothetical protein
VFVCFLGHNSGSMSHPQWECISKKKASPLLHQQINRPWQIVKWLCLSSPVSCFGTHFAQTWWNPSQSWMIPRQMHRWGTTSLIITCVNYPELWHGLIQHFRLKCMWTGDMIVLHQWHLCGNCSTWLSTSTYFAVVKDCFYTVLEVCNILLPLVHLQPSKIIPLHAALP